MKRNNKFEASLSTLHSVYFIGKKRIYWREKTGENIFRKGKVCGKIEGRKKKKFGRIFRN